MDFIPGLRRTYLFGRRPANTYAYLFSPVLDSLSPRGTSGGRVGEGGFLAAPPLPGPLLHRMEERERATLNTYKTLNFQTGSSINLLTSSPWTSVRRKSRPWKR